MFLVSNTEPTVDFLLHTQLNQSVQDEGFENCFAERTFSPLLTSNLLHHTALSQTHSIQIPHAHSPGVMCKSKTNTIQLNPLESNSGITDYLSDFI